MLINVRTAVVLPGKLGEAMAWAARVRDAVNQLGGELKLGTQIGARATTLVWIAEYKDFADFEQKSAMLISSSDYHKAISEAANLLVAGEIRDQLFRLA
jgi:hypothetical protein